MRKIIFRPILFIVLCWATIVTAADQQFIQNKASVKFTQNPDLDTYEITVRGTSIEDYVITYRILTYSGKELYSYSTKYATSGVDMPEEKEQIQEDLNMQTKSPCGDISSSLPSWAEIKNNKTVIGYDIKVSKSDYNRLRSKALPLCAHSSGYERFKYIIIDPVRKKARVLAEVHW